MLSRRLINKLQPGSIKKINQSKLNWHKVSVSGLVLFHWISLICWRNLTEFCSLKLENLGNFIKAILAYGLKPNDIFEANDLFENGNMTQVQTTLLALASMVS